MLKDTNTVKIANYKRGQLIQDWNLASNKDMLYDMAVLGEDYSIYLIGSSSYSDLTSLSSVSVGKYIIAFEDPANPPANWDNGINTSSNFTRHTDVIFTTLKFDVETGFCELYKNELDFGLSALPPTGSDYQGKLQIKYTNIKMTITVDNYVKGVNISNSIIHLYQNTSGSSTILNYSMGDMEYFYNSQVYLYENINVASSIPPSFSPSFKSSTAADARIENLLYESMRTTGSFDTSNPDEWGYIYFGITGTTTTSKIKNMLVKNIGLIEVPHHSFKNLAIDNGGNKDIYIYFKTYSGIGTSYIYYYNDDNRPKYQGSFYSIADIGQLYFVSIDRSKNVLTRRFKINNDYLDGSYYEVSISLTQILNTTVKYSNTFKGTGYKFQFKDNWYINDELKYFDYDDYLLWKREDLESELFPLAVQNNTLYNINSFNYRLLTDSDTDYEAIGFNNTTDVSVTGGSFSRTNTPDTHISDNINGYVLKNQGATYTGGVDLTDSTITDYADDWTISFFTGLINNSSYYSGRTENTLLNMKNTAGSTLFKIYFNGTDDKIYFSDGSTNTELFDIDGDYDNIYHFLLEYDDSEEEITVTIHYKKSDGTTGSQKTICDTSSNSLTTSTDLITLFNTNVTTDTNGFMGYIIDFQMNNGIFKSNVIDSMTTYYKWDFNDTITFTTDKLTRITFRTDENFLMHTTAIDKYDYIHDISYYDDITIDTLMGDVYAYKSNICQIVQRIYNILKPSESIEYKNILNVDDSPLTATIEFTDVTRNYVIR